MYYHIAYVIGAYSMCQKLQEGCGCSREDSLPNAPWVRTLCIHSVHWIGVVVCMRTLCPTTTTTTTTTTTPSATESEMSEQLNCCCNAHLPKKSRPTGHRNFMQNFGIRPKTLRFNLWLVMTIGLQCKHCDYGIEWTDWGCGLDLWHEMKTSNYC